MLGVAQLINEAWTYESTNESEVALRLYKTAFNNLLDLNGQINNIPGVSPFEIRSVADYVNHRTCHIQFSLNHARESINQFKKYIDTFKQHTKSPEYAFEHAAWLSQQYLMFADQFHQAVTNGVKASKAQHPGLYYYEAAAQMIERRHNITEYTNDTIRSNQMPVTNELLSMITTSNFASFLRQCGWVCIEPEAGTPTPTSKDDTILRALYKASEYFEVWNRPRMQNYINALIGREYLLVKDTQKAMAFYSKSLVMYEKEGWQPLVDSIKENIKIEI